MNLATISTVVMAALVLVGAIAGGIRWFYKRGGDERELAVSVNRHAVATTELAAQVGGLRETLERHGETLVEHHWRIRALEQSGTRVTVEKVGP